MSNYRLRMINTQKLTSHVMKQGSLDETPALHLLDTIRILYNTLDNAVRQIKLQTKALEAQEDRAALYQLIIDDCDRQIEEWVVEHE